MSKMTCPACKNETVVIGGRFGSHSGADWKTCPWSGDKVDRPSFAAVIVIAIVHTFNYRRDFYIPATQVAQTESLRTQQLQASHV